MGTKAKIVGVNVERQGPENDGDILVNYDDQWVLIRGEGRLWTDEEMGEATLRGDLFHLQAMAAEAEAIRLRKALDAIEDAAHTKEVWLGAVQMYRREHQVERT